MKKIIFTLVFSFFLNKSFSQEPLGFYAVAGLSSPQLKSSDVSGDSKISPVYGFAFNFGYNSSFNYQLEVLQHSKIFNFTSLPTSQFYSSNYDIDLGGTELGFYLNYFITQPDEDKVYFSTLVGPYFVFITGANPTDADPNSFIENSILKAKNLEYISSIDYGAGLGFCSAYKNIKLTLRYNLGLSNQFKNVFIQNSQDPEDVSYGFNAKTNSITLGLSYRFFSKKR